MQAAAAELKERFQAPTAALDKSMKAKNFQASHKFSSQVD